MALQKFKDNGVTPLTFLWSRDVIGHVPFDSRGSSSYPWSIVTMGTSGTVKDILRFKDNGVTTLTFCGHVTSSIT